MRRGMMFALFLAIAAPGSAAAQPSVDNARGGVPTETQSRMADRGSIDFIWDWLGLLGLLGLFGLRQEHAEDGYHPAPVE